MKFPERFWTKRNVPIRRIVQSVSGGNMTYDIVYPPAALHITLNSLVVNFIRTLVHTFPYFNLKLSILQGINRNHVIVLEYIAVSKDIQDHSTDDKGDCRSVQSFADSLREQETLEDFPGSFFLKTGKFYTRNGFVLFVLVLVFHS